MCVCVCVCVCVCACVFEIKHEWKFSFKSLPSLLQDMNLMNQDLTAKAFVNIMALDDPKVIDSQGGVNLELEV